MESERQGLRDTLTEIGERIEKAQKRKQGIGEANTKVVLIQPLLSALGWELGNLNEVMCEYRHKSPDNPVDYALFILGSPCLFIEAKALAADLSDYKWASQMLGYATAAGVEWCILTNGDEYRLYNAHAPVEVEKKLFRKVRISDLGQTEYTLRTLDLLSKNNMCDKRINALWKAHFVDRNVKKALEDLLTADNRSLVSWIRKKRPELARSAIQGSLKRADIQIEFPALTLIPSPVEKDQPDMKGENGERKSPKVIRVSVSDLINAELITPPVNLERDYKGAHLTTVIQQ